MSGHPLDQWVEVTKLGDSEPVFILAVDGREAAISKARAEYLNNRIDVSEFEDRIQAAFE